MDGEFEEAAGSCDDIRYIAWHEAGHAVVAAALGAREIEVSLEDAFQIGAYSARGVTNIWGTYLDKLESIPILLAGYFAERFVNPDRVLARRAAARDFDLVLALDPFARKRTRGSQWRAETFATPASWRRFLIGQVRIVVRLLRRHRKVVATLAELLLHQRPCLSPAEFRRFTALAGLEGERIREIFFEIHRLEAETPRDVDALSDLHEEVASLGGAYLLAPDIDGL